MFHNNGQLFARDLDVFKLGYHTLMYGVLTARGIAAGKSVWMGPWA